MLSLFFLIIISYQILCSLLSYLIDVITHGINNALTRYHVYSYLLLFSNIHFASALPSDLYSLLHLSSTSSTLSSGSRKDSNGTVALSSMDKQKRTPIHAVCVWTVNQLQQATETTTAAAPTFHSVISDLLENKLDSVVSYYPPAFFFVHHHS